MDLTPYVAALRDDLAAASTVGDEATARAATSLAAALEPAVRLTLMNALSDFAAEVSTALDDRSVDLRLHGREVEVVVRGADPGGEGGFYAGPSSSPFVGSGSGTGFTHRPGGPTPPPPNDPPGPPHGGPDVGDISRMTLRIVDQIKGQAERAAAAQGMSLNSWVAQAVQGALRGQGGWPGQGGHGWSGSRDWSGRGGWGPGWSGRWSGEGWPGQGWSGQGGQGWSGQGGQGGPGQDWPGRGDRGWPGEGWSQDPSTRPPEPGDAAPGSSGGTTPGSSGGTTPGSSGGTTPGSSGEPTGGASGGGTSAGDEPADRRRDDEGPDGGGVQGWVRG